MVDDLTALAKILVGQDSQLADSLRKMRVEQGLTVEQVAEDIEIPVQKVLDIENFNGARQGDIRLYALRVGAVILHVVAPFKGVHQ